MILSKAQMELKGMAIRVVKFPKEGNTPRKLLYFMNRVSAELSKSAKI